MKKWVMNLSLMLFVSLSMCTMTVHAEEYVQALTLNVGAHDYVATSSTTNNWTDPSNSALMYNETSGNYTRVEYMAGNVYVETYDSDFQFVSSRVMEAELPLFGGFYNGENYNFLIFGQTNPDEDDSVEVLRVVKYSKEWERLGQASLCGANTTIPFDAGGFSAAEYKGYLYIRTSHEMYASEDGTNHQANLTLNVRISDMKITDSCTSIANINYGYVSHSFNQYIRVDDDGTLVAADHGDANPRAVVLTRYYDKAGQDAFMTLRMQSLGGNSYTYVCAENVEALPITGMKGANLTGVSVGGFEISDSSYLTAGTCIRENVTGNLLGQRQIFVTVTSKEDFSSNGTSTVYLTEYEEGSKEVEISNPHLVKVNDDKFLMLWTELASNTTIQTLYYTFIDGEGEQLTETYSFRGGRLSDCVPIVANGKVVWYVTGGSVPCFFTIDLENPSLFTHECFYSISFLSNQVPTEYYGSTAICTCDICGEKVSYEVPDLNDESYIVIKAVEETCTTNGKAYRTYILPNNWAFTVYGTYSARHLMSSLLESYEASCEAGAYGLYHCNRCDTDFKNYTSDALGHRYGDWTLPEDAVCGGYVDYYHTCSRCGKTETQSTYYNHNYEQVVIAPTCTENGKAVLQCTRCGDVHHTDIYGYATGHEWSEWIVTGIPCNGTGGQIRTCSVCGETETNDLNGYVYEHSYVKMGDSDHCSDKCEWCGAERGHWYPYWYMLGENCYYCNTGIEEDDNGLFTDVKEGEWFYNSVAWAVENGITQGTSATEFSPSNDCTRAQVVTFLWRTAGSPKPETKENPFTDVKEGAYYYEAVLWAVEHNITLGTSETTFSPDKTCIRAQVVTFLYRYADEPAISAESSKFTDVTEDKYYYTPVLWAVEHNITVGTSNTTFSPDATCTRAQVVTFLYRYITEDSLD